MSDSRKLLERLIHEGLGSRRYTQDSPILPDVWLAYGLAPGEPQDLLLTPFKNTTPVQLKAALRERMGKERDNQEPEVQARNKRWPSDAQLACNQTSVAASLHFHEVMRIAMPLSAWWHDDLVNREAASVFEQYLDKSNQAGRDGTLISALGEKSHFVVWMIRIVGTIALLNRKAAEAGSAVALETLEDSLADPRRAVEVTFELIKDRPEDEGEEPLLWAINRNRQSEVAILQSAATIKADATRRLFETGGKGVVWAVLDSGIDATHPAFRKWDPTAEGRPPAAEPFSKSPIGKRWVNNTKIRATYDFTKIRRLLSADPDSLEGVPQELLEKATKLGLKRDLKRALKFGRDIDWELFKDLLEVDHSPKAPGVRYGGYKPPEHHHGTHVAGIIAADWRADDGRHYIGVCPEIELYDLRVLDKDGVGDEFSIMAALQFVRHMNSDRNLVRDLMEVHGANVSFSLRHEVSSYACGRTPICEECERLVSSGVVVVAAAGNRGRARYMTIDGALDEGYRPISITDPGNAEAVITVGATHRRDPHTFGVSYFSSRGPTGDGRQKPDLLAPGEKITSTIPGEDTAVLDGTSMAAPHVSGAAALLMACRSELRGRPDMVKRVLCDTATDLGRKRDFQGAGLVDILRALQSI